MISYSLLHTICDRIAYEIEGIDIVFMHHIMPEPISAAEFE